MEGLIILKEVALPSQILAESERAVKNGKFGSVNELIVKALKRELAAQKRAEIDAELADGCDPPAKKPGFCEKPGFWARKI